jgi:hypothetical protein
VAAVALGPSTFWARGTLMLCVVVLLYMAFWFTPTCVLQSLICAATKGEKKSFQKVLEKKKKFLLRRQLLCKKNVEIDENYCRLCHERNMSVLVAF